MNIVRTIKPKLQRNCENNKPAYRRMPETLHPYSEDEKRAPRVLGIAQDIAQDLAQYTAQEIAQDTREQFSVIYADPPWNVDTQRGGKGAALHYELMDIERIQKMPVAELATTNAVCFLWVCNGMYGIGEATLKSWGFTPISDFVWIKPRLGIGSYFRYASEKMLLGVRGNMRPEFKAQPNWGLFPVQDHSHKPEEIYCIIERMYPHGRFLELFARRRPPNPDWYIWGNEAPGGSDIVIPNYPVPEYSKRAKVPEIIKTDNVTNVAKLSFNGEAADNTKTDNVTNVAKLSFNGEVANTDNTKTDNVTNVAKGGITQCI